MATEQGWGERIEAYRPSKTIFTWSCLGCVAATMIVGFNWGGWVTGGTAAETALKAAAGARAELAASVCVTQFQKGPDATAKLASLTKTDSWKRGDMIEKGGWVTMPGVEKPVSGAADLCAKQLTELPAAIGSAG